MGTIAQPLSTASLKAPPWKSIISPLRERCSSGKISSGMLCRSQKRQRSMVWRTLRMLPRSTRTYWLRYMFQPMKGSRNASILLTHLKGTANADRAMMSVID